MKLRTLGSISFGCDRGATLVEYLLVTGAVSLLAVAAFHEFGKNLHTHLEDEAEHFRGRGIPDLGEIVDPVVDPGGGCPGWIPICIPEPNLPDPTPGAGGSTSSNGSTTSTTGAGDSTPDDSTSGDAASSTDGSEDNTSGGDQGLEGNEDDDTRDDGGDSNSDQNDTGSDDGSSDDEPPSDDTTETPKTDK